jgi:hypothetical protein
LADNVVGFEIKSCSRKCAATDQEIGRGDTYFSVVVQNDDAEMIRQDFSEAAWQGPPDDCIGWWQSKLPELDEGRVYWAPRDVLYAYFDKIVEQDESAETAYVMALAMVRKRLLKLVETEDDDVLTLTSSRHEQPLQVKVMNLTPQRQQQIQTELGEHLFTNRLAADDESEDTN